MITEVPKRNGATWVRKMYQKRTIY